MDPAEVNALQQELAGELKLIKSTNSKLQNLFMRKSKLQAQRNESDMVKQELDTLDEEAMIFKLVGPTLVRQDLEDAKTNVNARLKYFTEEHQRMEAQGAVLEKQQLESRKKVQKLQEDFRGGQQRAVAAATQGATGQTAT